MAHAETRLERVCIGLPHETVNPVCPDEQIAICRHGFNRSDFFAKVRLDSKGLAASLENLEDFYTRYARELIAMYSGALAPVNNIDVVPGFERTNNLCIGVVVAFFEIGEGLI